MRYLLIRTGLLAVLSLILVLHFSAMSDLARACTLGVAHVPSSAASFPVSAFSGRDAQDSNQVRPSTDLHCQFDTDAVAQASLNGTVPFKRTAYVPAEICLVGSTVDVSDKPPRRRRA